MKTLYLSIIAVLVSSTMFVTSSAYAPCIEGLGIDCNHYPPQALTQIKSDKLSYETSDKPVITIVGVPSAVAHLEIDDPSSNIIFTHDINLSSNGTVRYVLDISSYKPGVYSVIAASLISKLTTSFAVGLTTMGSPIMLNTDRNSYFPGDNVTISGWCNSNTMIQLSLIDPNGVSVKSMQIFSDKTGHFSSFDFSIPPIATHGTWKIDGTSGVNHVSVNITVDKIPGVSLDKAIMLSPLKQFKSGIAAKDVKCKEGLVRITKIEDGSPACVTPDTATKLVERGWTKMIFETGIAINSYTPISNETEDQTVKVVEIKMVPPYTPGGPMIQLTIQNVGTTPITNLNAILETNYNYTFNFQSITSSTPLISGNSVSNTTMLVGGGFQTESTYSLIISGMKDNMPFEYLEKVQIQG